MFAETRNRYFPVELVPGITARAVDDETIESVWKKLDKQVERPVLIAKLKAGFHVTGLSLDERFGAQVTLAYFFHPDRHQGFVKAFSLDTFEA